MCLQIHFQLLLGLLVKNRGYFQRVGIRPTLTKKPVLWPILLKRADLGKCWESFQTPWNAFYVLANGFPTTFGIVSENLGWFPRVHIGRLLLSKSLGYSPCFWRRRIWVSAGNRSKFPETPPVSLGWFPTTFGVVSEDFISEGSEIRRFWPKSLGYMKRRLPASCNHSQSCWDRRTSATQEMLLERTEKGKCWESFQSLQRPPMCLQIDFQLYFWDLMKNFGYF